MKKLRDRSGETLLESLVSILIIVLSLTFLATALVTAAKIQKAAQNQKDDFSYTGAPGSPGTVYYDLPGQSVEVEVTVRNDNDCWFYAYEDAAD